MLTLLALMATFSTNQTIASEPLRHKELIGESMYSYLFWDVYHISLYSGSKEFSFNNPFTLNLTYQREFKGTDITKQSITEMKGLGLKNENQLQKWRQEMLNLFPDISEGDTLTGIFAPQKGSKFYKNGNFIGEVKDHEFGLWFFGIWLNPNTSEPDLRSKLLGVK